MKKTESKAAQAPKTFETPVIPKDVKLQLIAQERNQWYVEREIMTMRHRVNVRLKSADGIKACEDALLRVETALAELEAIEAEIEIEYAPKAPVTEESATETK